MILTVRLSFLQGEGADTNSPSDSLGKQYSCTLLSSQQSQDSHNKRVSRIQKGGI